jgi:MFS family permease
VTAIVVVFTVPTSRPTYGGLYIVLATGLLVVSMLGSLLGAIGLAAIGAEVHPTANLAGSIMYIGVPVAVSLAAMLGAFHVLAALYVPEATGLFIMIVAAGGLFGVIFVAFTIADSTSLGPVDEEEHIRWSQTKKWLRTRKEANRQANLVGLIAILPIVLATIARFSGIQVHPGRAGTYALVGVGIGLTMVGTLASLMRSAHRPDYRQMELRRPEALLTTEAIALYVSLLIIFLP